MSTNRKLDKFEVSTRLSRDHEIPICGFPIAPSHQLKKVEPVTLLSTLACSILRQYFELCPANEAKKDLLLCEHITSEGTYIGFPPFQTYRKGIGASWYPR